MKIIIDPKKLVEVLQQKPHLAVQVAQSLELYSQNPLANALLNEGVATKVQSEEYPSPIYRNV